MSASDDRTVLERLHQHLQWANALVFDALTHALRPDPEVLRLLAHVLAAEELWIARLQGRPARYPVWPTMTLDQCAELSSENDEALAELLERLDDEGVRRMVRYRNSASYEFENSVGDILTHVAMHGQYHRGQIARQLRSLGFTPPYTDFIGFARRDQEGGTLDAGNASSKRAADR